MSEPIKLCKHCGHCESIGSIELIVCRNPEVVGLSPVDGETNWGTAEGCRSESGKCGPSGKLWEPRT